MSLFLFQKESPKTIQPFLSVVLDSMRIFAALVVVIFHGYEQWFPQFTSADSLAAKIAHSAVIIFFVLSGYVIAFTTSNKNRGGFQYFQARLSRLCSIVIPALFVTAVCEGFVSILDPKLHLLFYRPPIYFRYLISALFSNEIWFFSSAPPINGPLWSLSYEFWFYMIFGLWLYSGFGWRRILVTILGCAIAGPKILLLMPVWLMGCFAYLIPQKKIFPLQAVLVFGIFLIFTGFLTYQLPIYPYLIGAKPFYFANQFVTDWIIGLSIATAIWVISEVKTISVQPVFSNQLRFIADLTFPVYVLHNPLFVLWRAIFGTQLSSYSQMWKASIIVLVLSGFIGFLLEKQRYIWIRLFKYLLDIAQSVFNKNQIANEKQSSIKTY